MPKKANISIPKGEWGSQVSKYPADSDLVGITDLTENSKNYATHEKGVLTKRKGSVLYSTLSNPAVDQYEGIFSDGVRHLLTVQNGTVEYSPGDRSVNSIVNGSGFSTSGSFEFATITDRIYAGNGVNAGQVYDRTAVYGGAAPVTVPRLKTMGCQIPGSAPTATIVAGAGVPVGGHTYKVTFMYYETEESNGGAASNLVTVVGGANQQVDLSSVPIGGYGVTSRKIYRDDNDGIWRLVGEISNNTATTFSDNASVGTATIPTDNGIPPVFGLITNFLDRAWIADIVGEPHTIRHSEAGFPNIFRSTNFVVCNERDPITAITVFLDRIVVFNRNSMGQILGKTSDAFRYAEVQSSVGCVDTRTVQTRIIRGVPHLVWLSDKGIYAYNGNSVEYISEPIEDLVNFNIQQGVRTEGQNSQTSQADFQAGTASDGINLVSSPGDITTKGPLWDTSKYPTANASEQTDPSRLWDDQDDWEEGTEYASNKSALSNVGTKDLSNKMSIPSGFDVEPATEGTKNGVIASGVGIKLDTAPVFTGKDNFAQPVYDVAPFSTNVTFDRAQQITIANNGSVTQISAQIRGDRVGSALDARVRLVMWDDVGGQPGAVPFFQGATHIIPDDDPPQTISESISKVVTVGQKYWIGFQWVSGGGSNYEPLLTSDKSVFPGLYLVRGLAGWVTLDTNTNNMPGNLTLKMGYAFTETGLANSGQWVSDIQDSKSDNVTATISITHSSTIPALTTIDTKLEGSDDPNFTSGAEVSESDTDLSGTFNTSLSGKRYWRVRIQLDTTDNRVTPEVTTSVKMKMNTTGEWISEAIDCTSDVTAYNTFTVDSTIPSGASVVTEVRTAATQGGLTAAPWVAFGSVVVRQWFQIRITMSMNTTTQAVPTINSITFAYTIVANLISSQINTGVTPAGWDVFQESSTLNGGTLVFEMRSAAAPGGLAGATWYAVTNGAFPTASLPVEQYVQWRITSTASTTDVPDVAAVVVNWLVSSSLPIRAASLFYDKHYYLSGAKFGSSVNNIVVIFNPNNKWRIWEDINISTISLFFNIPYYGNANDGKVLKMFEGNLDLGTTNIPFDVRTKAFDFSNEFTDNRDKQKIMLDAVITGKNTGATYNFYYSTDVGNTWISLQDDEGSASFTTASDGGRFTKRFKAQHQIGVDIDGRTIVFRAFSNDANNVELHKFKIRVLIRKGEPLG